MVLVILGAAAGYGSWSYRNAEDHRRQARAELDDRDFERAKTDLRAYLAARPNDAEAHFLLAQACRRARVEDFAESHRQLDEARRLGWSAMPLALESAMLDVQENGAVGDRELRLRSYLDSNSDGAELVLESLARGCLLLNNLEEANGWLNAWVARAPDDWFPRLWRGSLFAYKSHANLAIADFEFILKKKPADEETRKRLGLVLVESGYDYEAALKYLESYRRNHADDVDALVGIAQCQRNLGRSEAAETLLQPVVAAHPDHVNALLTLALVESDRGNDAKALELLRRLEPLARQYREPEELKALCRLDPVPVHADVSHQTRTVLNLQASCLRRLGRTEEADRYEAEGEQAAADFDQLKKALAEQNDKPIDAPYLDKVGALYLRIGMADAGKTYFERALKKRPDDAIAHRGLADYYESRGDPDSRRLAEEHRRLAAPAGTDRLRPQDK